MFCNLHTLCYGCVQLCAIHENPIQRGGCLKKGGLGQFADLKGDLSRISGVVFLRGFDTPMHTMHRVTLFLQDKRCYKIKCASFCLLHTFF